jgi:YtcA family
MLLPTVLLTGCQRAPSVSILGSFFPVWIFCAVAGIVIASLAHTFFVRLRIDTEIHPPILVYPSIAASAAVTLWLVLFR